MTKSTPSSLPIYLAGLGAATVLASTSNAAVVMLDVSSIFGKNNGGVSPGDPYGERFALSSTSGGLEVNFQLWDSRYIGIQGVHGTGIAVAYNPQTYNMVNPKAFGIGTIIDSSSIFTGDIQKTAFYYQSDGLSASSLGAGSYLGFVTTISSNNYYGWLEVTWDADMQIFQILSGAYESQANMGIEAGAIPEPSSLALLAAGAAGVATLRRRKKAA